MKEDSRLAKKNKPCLSIFQGGSTITVTLLGHIAKMFIAYRNHLLIFLQLLHLNLNLLMLHPSIHPSGNLVSVIEVHKLP